MTRQEVLAIVKAAVEAQDPHTATDVLYTAMEKMSHGAVWASRGLWLNLGYEVGRLQADAPPIETLESLGQADLVDFVKGLCEGLEVNHA